MSENRSGLKETFYSKASPECNHDLGVYKPAVAFEVFNKVTGIAGNYHFPGGMSATEYESTVVPRFSVDVFSKLEDPMQNGFLLVPKEAPDPEVLAEMKNQWEQLKKLNPELNVIDLGDCDPELMPMALFDCIEGCASLFNPDDINTFVKTRIESRRFDVPAIFSEDPDYSKVKAEVSNLAEYRVGWVPSKATLKLISGKLKEKINADKQPTNEFKL